MANTTKNTYRFKTVMVEDADRGFVTALRNRLAKKAGKRVTDKELFSAIWAEMDVKRVSDHIVSKAKTELEQRELRKLEALKAKVDAKLAATQTSDEEVEVVEEVTEEVAA
jgi:DNA-binding response OmpR family regulator